MVLKILCISGSLRKGSILTGIIRYAIESAPKTADLEFLDLHGVPLYDGDLDPTEKRGPAKVWPPSVANLRNKVNLK
jgi:NAD(P)H-dependent FMN reductase